MMNTLLLIITLSLSLQSFSQKDSIYRPTTLEEMFLQMDKVLSPTQIKLIKELTEDSIKRTNPYVSNLTKQYDYYNDSKVVTDLEKKGLNYDDRYVFIALSYHRYLNGLDLKLEEQYHYHDSLRIERGNWYKEAQKRDSVDGKYIPESLVDCFIELDKILSEKDKKYILKNGATGLHMTLGMFLRNRWQLWGGSRLQKYFIDINGGMMHPDSMSGVILRQYEKWLKGDKTSWREWEIERRKKNNSR
jgi:hypothetical protein